MNDNLYDLTKTIHTRTSDGFKENKIFWEKVVNTFLYFPSLWPLIIKDAEVNELLGGNYKEAFSRKILRNILWFWPRLTHELPWVNGGPGLLKNPEAFSSIPLDHSKALELFSNLIGDFEEPILDLGCNMGRHLNHLHEFGHNSLCGVDIMETAFTAFQDKFPETYSICNLRHDIFQHYLMEQPDRSFSGLYTFGATVEYNHPSFSLVREVCRVTDKLVMFSIHENQGGHPRFWTYQFYKAGFDLIFAIRPWRKPENPEQAGRANESLLIYRRKTEN